MQVDGFKGYWTERFHKQEKSYRELASSWDPYVRWSSNSKPDATAEDDLINGLKVAFGDGPSDMARRFLQRAIEVADRAIAEGKFESDRCKGLYPANLARAIRTKAFCSSIIENRTHANSFKDSSHYTLEWCKTEADWDAVASNFYLTGISCALLGADFQTAEVILRAGQAPEHKKYVRILGALVQSERSKIKLQEKDRKTLEEFFDQVRDPTYNHKPPLNVVIGPFVVACLYDKYVIAADGNVDWKRAIERFAA